MNVKVAPKLFVLFISLPGPVPLASAVGIIVGKVNLPSASLQVKIRPAWSAIVRVVSAVKLTTFPTPAPMKPLIDFTGP